MDCSKVAPIGMTRWMSLMLLLVVASELSAEGILRFSIRDEQDGQPVVSRIVVTQVGKNRPVHLRRCEPAGTGVILDRQQDVSVRDGDYQFELVRGPEYRIVSGTFSLEKLSDDQKSVSLPRMVDMYQNAWVSGDAAVMPAKGDLPLRMAGEDLHVAMLADPTPDRPSKSPRRPDDPIQFEPLWIQHDVRADQSLILYGLDSDTPLPAAGTDALIAAKRHPSASVVAANPFDWRLPVWLASGKLDGVFVLGDWLRTDRSVTKVRGGRPVDVESLGVDDPGRWAEFIYHQMLEAGFETAPFAGGGIDTGNTPLGYNRIYTAPTENGQPVGSTQQWLEAALGGRTMLTNGPLLRCRMNDQPPGHRFDIQGETRFDITINLAVRDPVEYLDIIHNGDLFYSAPLDEFAKTGGRLPPIITDKPGWVIARVVTKHSDHYRFAMTAPWFIHASGQSRVTASAVNFWRTWLDQLEQRLIDNPALMQAEGRYIPATRKFWDGRASEAQ